MIKIQPHYHNSPILNLPSFQLLLPSIILVLFRDSTPLNLAILSRILVCGAQIRLHGIIPCRLSSPRAIVAIHVNMRQRAINDNLVEVFAFFESFIDEVGLILQVELV